MANLTKQEKREVLSWLMDRRSELRGEEEAMEEEAPGLIAGLDKLIGQLKKGGE